MNYYGFWTLLKKEVWRFLKVYHQTLLSPVINVLLLLIVFNLAFSDRFETSYDISFIEFMSSGLIIMAAIQSSFANSSSSFVMSKVLGYIVDYIIPPLGALELSLAMIISSIMRGIIVGLIAILSISLFYQLHFYNILFMMFFLIFGGMFLAILGVLCGIIANSFDQMSAVTSYFITPMTFLSGTFYSVKDLSIFWQNIAYMNPFFHIIDGFRYGMTGYKDSPDLMMGIIYIISVNIILYCLTYYLLKLGCKVKN